MAPQPAPKEAYDAIVIGAGPAGSAAAYTLASKGLKVCFVDKTSFPREKLCGGLITYRSMVLLSSIFNYSKDNNLFLCTSDVVFKMKGETLSSTVSKRPLFFTMRYDFDAMLVKLAENAGATLKFGSGILELDLNQRHLILESGEFLRYRFLVGADGVNSQIARQLFGQAFDRDTIGFGLEVEVPHEAIPNRANFVEIEFDAARWGYGWVFPKRSGYTVGVGGIHALNPDLRERLKHFLAMRGLDAGEFRVKGQYIPFGDFRARPTRDNVLLCGDAAGLVDPITGEGISYALESGAAAGNAISREILSKGVDTAERLYSQSYKHFVHSIRQANLWRNLIFPEIVQRSFAYTFADASTMQGAYLDILAGEQDYDDLYRVFLIQTAKAGRKLVKKLAHSVGLGGPLN